MTFQGFLLNITRKDTFNIFLVFCWKILWNKIIIEWVKHVLTHFTKPSHTPVIDKTKKKQALFLTYQWHRLKKKTRLVINLHSVETLENITYIILQNVLVWTKVANLSIYLKLLTLNKVYLHGHYVNISIITLLLLYFLRVVDYRL